MIQHIVHAIRVVRHALRTIHEPPRSPLWPKVEHTFRTSHPNCAGCGGVDKLNVHHMQPFHLKPELELDPKNLITLCMGLGKDCHILIGHGDDFKAYNPAVELMAAKLKAAYQNNDKEQVAALQAQAKATRRYQLA